MTKPVPHSKSKMAKVIAMLHRKSGCTAKEIYKTAGYIIAIPSLAKRRGFKLRKVKSKGKVTRYFVG